MPQLSCHPLGGAHKIPHIVIPRDIEDAFYTGKRTHGFQFGINDSVRVILGEYAGVVGAVISIWTLTPEVILLVERGDTGSDIQVLQKSLQLIE